MFKFRWNSQILLNRLHINPLNPSGHYMYRQWSLYVPPALTLTNSTFCPHSVFMCFECISEQTAIISIYCINWLVLGAFRKFRRATISFVMYVCLSERMEQLGSHRTDFHEI